MRFKCKMIQLKNKNTTHLINNYVRNTNRKTRPIYNQIDMIEPIYLNE